MAYKHSLEVELADLAPHVCVEPQSPVIFFRNVAILFKARVGALSARKDMSVGAKHWSLLTAIRSFSRTSAH